MTAASAQDRAPLFSRPVLLRALAVFAPLLAAAGLILGAFYWSQTRSERQLVEVRERNHVRLENEIVLRDFESLRSDLMVLAESPSLAEFLSGPDDEKRRAVVRQFRSLAEHKGIYDQVRLLDETGQEVVRINRRTGYTQVVPPEELQPKGERYYFREAFPLPRGEVFVSPLDLNVENGRIERPLKPTIRLATPVFDRAGERRGIVVLNYLASILLDQLRAAAVNAPGGVQLVNDEGYWLLGERPEDEWGFMFPERRERTFANRYPDEWQTVRGEEHGQFVSPAGMFTFETVHPVTRILGPQDRREASQSAPPDRADAGDAAWKIVSHVPAARLQAGSGRLFAGLLPVFAGMAAILLVVSWLLAHSRVQQLWAQDRLLQSERLAAIGEAMTGLTHESRNALQRSQAGLDMLQRRVRDRPDESELLDEVRRAQRYLHDLYEEVRGYAAPIVLERRPTDLRRLLEGIWEQLRGEREEKQAQLLEEAFDGDLTCQVDPRAMGQVLRNVLENALGAAPSPAEVRVRFAQTTCDGSPAVAITIRDNGPGLSPEQARRIFDPFYTTKSRGTGLGMAISKRIVTAHGGTIAVGSNHAPGAEIVITLPRSEP